MDVTIDAADTEDLTAKEYSYELWRTDTGNRVRLAYGKFPVIA